MTKAKPVKQKVIINRRAKYDYSIGDILVVGIELTGAETKSLRLGHGQLTGSYVTIKDNQLFLLNATINGTNSIRISESEQTRTRKLLAKRREINKLIDIKNKGRTIIPLEILTQGRYIKLKIAVAEGKKNYDKRETLKKRSAEKNIATQMKRRSL